jgi:xylulokinase
MGERSLVLGIDSSTQSTTAVILDRQSFAVVAEARVRYRDDPRLAGFGLEDGPPLLPPREAGEADQPAGLFLAALDAVLSDLPPEALASVAAVDISAQQHGQVWLGPAAAAAIHDLGRKGSGGKASPDLLARLGPVLSTDRAPIWMSANTAVEAEELRTAAGGAEAMAALSGSDSPLRFSGAVLRHRALGEPSTYAATSRIHLISSFLAAVLAGREDAPLDWGNGSGMSLMDWKEREWSPLLLSAAARGLPQGEAGLRSRLPSLAHPLTPIGGIAAYFSERYGIPPEALVIAGSGDNPQTKVLATGALLSLGTSFVLMTEGERPHPRANAMYDGLGRPFLFGCRTNGALCWESLRVEHGREANDFEASERALADVAPGSVLRILQLQPESFPTSPKLHVGRMKSFEEDYAGVVDSSLGLLYLGALPFAAPAREMSVTGGAAASPGTLKRIAAIWGCRVAAIGEAGAAAGAAVAAAAALEPPAHREGYAAAAAAAVSRKGASVEAEPAALQACHGADGYLARLARLFDQVSGEATSLSSTAKG